MSDTDSDSMAEAYHVLGALRYQQDQAKQALQQQITEIARKGDELTKQLEEAQQLDDGDAIERITSEIEDLHRAYALASDELEQHEPETNPEKEEPNDPGSSDDHPERRADSPLPADGAGREPDQQAPSGRESEPDSSDE